MTPSSALAALFVLSLVPGWVFLRASEGARPPRPQTALLELLEVVAVGLATTGASAVLWVLWKPSAVLNASRSPATADDLRETAVVALVILGLAAGIALVLAAGYRARSKSRYVPGVWQAVYNKKDVPRDHLPWVRIELVDGGAVEGVLWTYTHGSDVAHRDLALVAPIYKDVAGVRRPTKFDRLTISGEQAKTVAVRYTPQTGPDRDPHEAASR